MRWEKTNFVFVKRKDSLVEKNPKITLMGYFLSVNVALLLSGGIEVRNYNQILPWYPQISQIYNCLTTASGSLL